MTAGIPFTVPEEAPSASRPCFTWPCSTGSRGRIFGSWRAGMLTRPLSRAAVFWAWSRYGCGRRKGTASVPARSLRRACGRPWNRKKRRPLRFTSRLRTTWEEARIWEPWHRCAGRRGSPCWWTMPTAPTSASFRRRLRRRDSAIPWSLGPPCARTPPTRPCRS